MNKNKYDLKQIETLCSRIDCDKNGRSDGKRNKGISLVQTKKTAKNNQQSSDQQAQGNNNNQNKKRRFNEFDKKWIGNEFDNNWACGKTGAWC